MTSSDISVPKEIFARDYTGEGIDYHCEFEIGIDTNFFKTFNGNLSIGVKLPYARIEEFTSNGEKMKYNNGKNVEARIIGLLLYFGAGVYI